MINETKDQNQSYIKSLQQFVPKHCDNCGHKYVEESFRIVKKSEYGTLIHLSCKNCGNSYMINVLNPIKGVGGASRMPIRVDISSGEEIKKFVGKPPISSDDVIDIHNWLKSIKSGKAFKNLSKDSL